MGRDGRSSTGSILASVSRICYGGYSDRPGNRGRPFLLAWVFSSGIAVPNSRLQLRATPLSSNLDVTVIVERSDKTTCELARLWELTDGGFAAACQVRGGCATISSP